MGGMGGVTLPYPTRWNVVNDIFSILNELIGKMWKVSLRSPVHNDGLTLCPWLLYRNSSIIVNIDYN